MGWKGAVRSIGAAIRQVEREQQRQVRSQQREEMRRYRELQQRLAVVGKMHEQEQAKNEVELHESLLDVLLSFQKDCGPEIDWHELASAEQPKKPHDLAKPQQSNYFEYIADTALSKYRPSIWDRLLKRSEVKRKKLEDDIRIARERDKQSLALALASYKEALEQQVSDWQEEVKDWDASRKLASRVLAGDEKAYVEAIERLNPFAELKDLGSTFRFKITPTLVEIRFHVHDEDVIPSEVKSLTKSGKVSRKQMPVGKRMEIYQDHVCGCAARLARETFALLPVEICIVTAYLKLLDSQTGHKDAQPILSVAFPRKTCSQIKWQSVDPSDSMKNFIHSMKFKRAVGFDAVEPIRPSDLNLANCE